MFFPPKLTTILLGQLIAVTMMTSFVEGQSADFERRMAAMQEARVRAQIPASESVRIATTDMGVEYAEPPAPPARMAQAAKRVVLGQPGSATRAQPVVHQQTHTRAPVRRVAQATAQNYTPQHLRTAQLSGETFIDGGSPILAGSQMISGSQIISGSPVVSGTPMAGTVVGAGAGGCGSCGMGGCGGNCGGYSEVIQGDCNTCGDAGGYFDSQQCCGRGGCPPGQCWLTGIGAVLYQGEYFGGATSFRSALFSTPGGAAGALSEDNSHGFYGGVNFGFPLCKLSCGMLSGQIGVRSVNTNFDGNEFTSANRDQLFVTAGFFRRVDYGLQGGVVADILHEEWFTETDTVQIRGELSWVYPAGSNIGFRFATNTQDDVTSGTFAGNAFTNLVTASQDQYRFFYRREGSGAGYGEVFVGWTDDEQTTIGLDFDRAIGERLAMQAGFTYFLDDSGLPAGSTNLGGNAGEAYNIFVGLALRPRGRSYYRSYDRPLFSVADNGSMLVTRSNGQ